MLKEKYNYPNLDTRHCSDDMKRNMREKAIHKFHNNINTENSHGDYLFDCKNCVDCFDLIGAEDCKYYWEAG